MRHARFFAAGRIHQGTVTAEGRLLDEAGRPVDDEAVTWLPPVAPDELSRFPRWARGQHR